jgi:RimJ/RimL family protein N-acetyltransferase
MIIRLCELELYHIPQLNQWRNDPDLIETLGTGFNYISEEVDKNWYADYLANRDKSVRLAILADNKYVGNVNLTQINNIHRSAEFSILIGDSNFRGKGIGLHSSLKILDHGFKNLGLQRIWLSVLTSNEAAFNLYKKMGFEEEGVLRKAIFKNGNFHNLKIMSLLN